MTDTINLCVRYGTAGATVGVAADIAMLVTQFLGERITEAEHFCLFALTVKNQVTQLEVLHVGTLSSSIVCPRRVFRSALLANACSIIVAHNHPSGDPTPSPEDIEVTKKLVTLGKQLSLPVLDHVVVSSTGKFESIATNNSWLF